jgi:hypothetical protein
MVGQTVINTSKTHHITNSIFKYSINTMLLIKLKLKIKYKIKNKFNKINKNKIKNKTKNKLNKIIKT